MDERDLLIMKYLRNFKNITKTANALFLSQPALTRRLKKLSKELNTQLLQSTNQGIQLTPAGLETSAFADKMLSEIEIFKKQLRQTSVKSSMTLTISAPNIICEYYLPSVIREFKKTHSNVIFNIIMAPSSKVVDMMNNNESDFGFLRNDFGWNSEEQLLLTTNYIVAAATHPFKLDDLASMKRIAYTTDTYYMKMLDLWWTTNFPTEPHIDIQVNSLNLCREMVFNGFGFGLLPSVIIPHTKDIHTIVLNGQNNKPIERHTYLIIKKEFLNTKLKKDFLIFIKNSVFNDFLLLNALKH